MQLIESGPDTHFRFIKDIAPFVYPFTQLLLALQWHLNGVQALLTATALVFFPTGFTLNK